MKTLAEQIEAVVTPSLEGLGYRLVQLKLIDGRKSQTLQIMAEKPDGTMTLDDCALVSNQLSAVLDVEDVMPQAYRLEVSSPGIDRPLVRAADYQRYLGHLAKVETHFPLDGRKRFTGTLQALEGEILTLVVDNRQHTLPLSEIANAKLVLTDALLKQGQASRVSGNGE